MEQAEAQNSPTVPARSMSKQRQAVPTVAE
jgi:hypothetical protein